MLGVLPTNPAAEKNGDVHPFFETQRLLLRLDVMSQLFLLSSENFFVQLLTLLFEKKWSRVFVDDFGGNSRDEKKTLWQK